MFISTSKQKSKTKILLIVIKQNDIKTSTLEINIYKKQNNKCYFCQRGQHHKGYISKAYVVVLLNGK